MKKALKAIDTIAAMGVMLILTYWPGTIQANTVTEVQTVAEMEEAESVMEAALDGCVDIASEGFHSDTVNIRTMIDFTVSEYSLQLYFKDGTGYYWEW